VAAEHEREHEGEAGIEMPAPTAWPMIASLGITLGFAGLVTHVLVTLTGLVLTLMGVVGWWREVLPREHEEAVPLAPLGQRASPVEPRPSAVRHLEPGEGSHRVRIPEQIHPYRAGLWGGAVGAVAMAAVAVGHGLVVEDSIWWPINLLAAIVMPSLSGADVAALHAFNGTALAVGIGIHAVASLFVGLTFAMTLPMFPRYPLVWGGLIAPFLWSAVLWLSMGILAPTLAQHVSWPWFVVSQVAFGVAAGLVISRSERVKTLQSLPLVERAGIEASGLRTKEDD